MVLQRHRALLGVALLTLLCGAVSARAERLQFRHLTSEHGLSQLFVQCIVQSPDGHLWMGTQSGLNRFDGRHFQVFTVNDGLPSDWIEDLHVGSDGTLWVATREGLARIGPDLDVVPVPLPRSDLRCLADAGDGALALGTAHGLFRWDGTTLQPLGLDTVEELTQVRGLDRGPDGTLFAATDRGLLAVGNRGCRVLPLPEGMHELTDVEFADDGTLWVAGTRGLVALQDGQVVRSIGPEEVERIPHLTSVETHDGQVWASSELGLLHVTADRVEFLTADQGLPFLQISETMVDASGMVWIGGIGGSAVLTYPAFRSHGIENGLPSNNVRPVLRSADGVLWVGTTRGPARREGTDFVAVPLPWPEQGPSRQVLAIFEDRQQRLWIGTGGGLFRRRGTSFEFDPVDPERLGVWVDSIVQDVRGDYWICVRDRFLAHSRDGERFEPVSVPGQSFSNARALAHSDGTLYVSGQVGLSAYDGESWRTLGVSDGLAGPRPYFLCEDHDQNVWFGYHSSRGLTRYDGSSFRTFTEADGLASMAVFSIGEDPFGNLWVGTARGVDRFDGESFFNLSTPEGYPSPESNSGGFFVDVDSTLWFGTAAGLAHYDHRVAPDVQVAPRLEISHAQWGGVEVESDADFEAGRHEFLAHVPVLSFVDPRRIERRYRLAGLDDAWRPLDGDVLRIHELGPGAFRLDVQARQYGGPWSESASMAWRIRPPWWQSPAALAGGVLLVVLAIFLGERWQTQRMRRRAEELECLVADRTAEIERRNEHQAQTLSELESTKTKLEEVCQKLEVSSRAKTQFVADMSHEIRTPMNGVIGMASLLLETPLDEEQQEYVEIINRSGENLVKIINEILDFSKIEAGRLELEQIPFDLRDCIDDAVEAVAIAVSRQGIDLVVDIDPTIFHARRGDTARLRQVLVNLLGNAVKFTSEGEVELRVTAVPSVSDQGLRFSVRDTGVGMTEEQQHGLFQAFAQADASVARKYGGTGLGLVISNRLVEAMGGRIDLRSEAGVGTCFSFDLELPLDPEADAARAESMDLPFDRAILLVPNDCLRRVLGRDLEAVGIDCIAFAALEELDVLTDDPPEILFVDASVRGVDTLQALRSRLTGGAPTQVVALLDFDQRLPSNETQDVQVLRKPVRRHHLVTLLSEYQVPTEG